MRYFIHAYDTVYCGMHDIYDANIFDDADYAKPWDRDTLNDVGEEMARDVIDSYALNYDLPEEEDFGNEDEFEEAYFDAMNELLGWSIYVIRPEFDDMSTAELRDKASTYDPEYFAEEYCTYYEG